MSRRSRYSLAVLVFLAVMVAGCAFFGALRPPSTTMRWSGLVLAVALGGVAVATARRSLLRLEELEREIRELSALEGAARRIQSELELNTLLQTVTDQARRLLGATYGALSLSDTEGKIRKFITSGLSQETRNRIGPLPAGTGLLAIPLNGRPLRIANIRQDPRSTGFPLHHPVMTSLLAVPVPTRTTSLATLYLADKVGSGSFSEEDLESLRRFATSAALAIDNSTLARQKQALAVAEERLRISREMHDGMAQILGYVNNKAQAARAYLDRGNLEQATAQLEQLVAAGHELSADVREGIAALRTEIAPDQPLSRSLASYLRVWRDRSDIPVDLQLVNEPSLPADTVVQLLRIVQESLTNVRRHSAARHVTLRIEGGNDRLSIRIVDDGKGFDPSTLPQSGHYGLAVMNERAQAIGAGLQVQSEVGKGTSVELTMSLVV
ncbi:MAG: GAF domain-containing sensor histidine kinase [Acidobacteria bacterium]|nr:GAF domain-containing sensor histidine kinase [Acidobacteriota bacterium]